MHSCKIKIGFIMIGCILSILFVGHVIMQKSLFQQFQIFISL